MTEKPWHSRLSAAVRHPTEPRVLLTPKGDRWGLPQAVLDDRIWYSGAGAAAEAIGKMLGMPLWGLRWLAYGEDEERKRIDALFELELLDPDWLPPDGYRWVDAQGFKKLQLAPADFQPTLARYLTELDRGTVPETRPPWALPGWHASVRDWITTRLGEVGRRLKKIEQVKQWGISNVLRAKTDRGDYYFKTTNPRVATFGNEARITSGLAEIFPDQILAPLAVDEGRDWMLQAGFDQLFGPEVPGEILDETLRRFAHLQIASLDKTDRLFAAGCADRRLDRLEASIDPLLRSPIATRRLEPEQAAELRGHAPALKDLCRKLAAAEIRPALVHGDLDFNNTAIHRGVIVYFDWTDACITHPFFDLLAISGAGNEARREQLIDAYLGPWGEIVPMARVRAIHRIANVLMYLHHAVSYWQIIEALEPAARPELDFTHAILRDLLARFKEYQADPDGVD